MIVKLNEIRGRIADRDGRKPSLEEISEATGMSRILLTDISKNQAKTLRPEHIDALCAYFGVTAGDLIQSEPITLPLSLNIRPDRHGAKVGQRTKGKAVEPDLLPEPAAANLRKPLANLT